MLKHLTYQERVSGIGRAAVVSIVALGCLCGLADTAIAQEAWVYGDQWVAEDGDHNDAIASNTVETYLTQDLLIVSGYIYYPSGGLARFTQSSGFGSVTNDIDWCIENEGEDGDYAYIVEFNIIGEVPYHGSWAMQKFGAGRFAYILDFIWVGGLFANYHRCNPGPQCVEMTVLKSAIKPPQSTWPLYIFMKLVWIQNSACAGSAIEAAPVCVADNYPQ